jgi:hypothetical protein
MTHHSAAHRSQAMNECIDNCTQCHEICLETINYCLTKGASFQFRVGKLDLSRYGIGYD